MKKVLLLLLFSFILLSACKRKKDATPIEQSPEKISSGLYPLLFNINSYWVYRDTVSNALDSVALTDVNRSTYNVPPLNPGTGSQGTEEIFVNTLYSSHTNNTFHETYIGDVISIGDYSSGYIYLGGTTVGTNSGLTTLTAMIDSLTINNHTYHHVKKISLGYSPNFKYYYWADYIGLIRKEIETNSIITERWDLQRNLNLIYPY